MRFNSLQFAIFLPIVFLLWTVLRGRARQVLLLGASYFFYATWNAPFLLLLWFTTILDYWCGLRIGAAEDPRRRKAWLLASIVANLGVLVYFKYGNFFLENVAFISNVDPTPFYLDVIIPLGISFYTFQSMSYVIDVYRREIEPCRDLLQYSLFVTFFPHLIAGPILRAGQFLPQLHRADPVRQEELLRGIELFLVGLFLKMVVADNLGGVVDRVFEAPTRFNAAAIALASIMFAAQVYCDFNGYSTMARGLGWMFGFQLPKNFDYPLLRWNPLLFRKSWHITMGNWFQDYVFRPLGGSAVGDARFAFNLFIMWFLLGLWHGASWHFVAWGASNGLQLALYLVVLRRKTWSLPAFPGKRFCGWLINFSLWIPGAIFFRAQTMGEAGVLLKRIFTGAGGFGLSWTWYAVMVLLGAIHLASFRYYKENLLERSGWPARVALVSGTALVVATLGATGRTFIYFQF